MQQHTKIVPVDPEAAAHFVLVPLFEEDLAEHAAVTLRELFQDFANLILRFFGSQKAQQIRAFGGEVPFLVVIEGIEAGASPVMLEQNVVTDGDDKSTQTLGLKNSSVAQSDKEAKRRIRAFLDRKTAKVKPG